MTKDIEAKVTGWSEHVNRADDAGRIAREAIQVVAILREKVDELFEDVQFLNALEAAGVDNWDGYAIAQEMMQEND